MDSLDKALPVLIGLVILINLVKILKLKSNFFIKISSIALIGLSIYLFNMLIVLVIMLVLRVTLHFISKRALTD